MSTELLRTSIGDFSLNEYHLTLSGRRFSFLHTGAVVTYDQERDYLGREQNRLPYGVMLWPASIALAHEMAARGDRLRGKRILELGAGTGVPGIVAGSFGAHVLQIDRDEVALHVCALNHARNEAKNLEVRDADWDRFHSDQPFDLVIGSDVLYVTDMHARLRAICDTMLAPGGTVLFSDPLRAQSLPMMVSMEASGWRVSLNKWSVGVDTGGRGIVVYEATRP